MRTLRRVAVLGAGTMGARIAAQFANAGVPSLLLDVVEHLEVQVRSQLRRKQVLLLMTAVVLKLSQMVDSRHCVAVVIVVVVCRHGGWVRRCRDQTR